MANIQLNLTQRSQMANDESFLQRLNAAMKGTAQYWNDVPDLSRYVYQGDVIVGIAVFVRNIIGNGNYLGRDGNVPADASTYMCDANWGATGNMGLRSGGAAVGAAVGLSVAYSSVGPGVYFATTGTRLCYLP